MSRGVFCRAATTELRLGCEVLPLMEANAKSTTSTPASLARKILAALMPLVSWVWKWMGILTSPFSALTSFWAA